ncbi:MAG TPA: hypothetical protein VGK74_11475 [Symbiobacteriaceae bacterium]|jgi:hypothetical protein
MPKRSYKRTLGFVLATMLAGGLLAFAAVSVLRWHGGQIAGVPESRSISAAVLELGKSPLLVQETAHRLSTSRVGFAVDIDKDTYLIISTGDGGERIAMDTVRVRSGKMADVLLKQSPNGSRLLVVRVAGKDVKGLLLRYYIDNTVIIPSMVNPNYVPPVALPAKTNLVLVEPRAGARIAGKTMMVSGFARLGVDERFSVKVIADGKGVVLASQEGLRAAALAPDWGSFWETIQVQLPQGITGVNATVILLNEKTGEKISVPVHFGK